MKIKSALIITAGALMIVASGCSSSKTTPAPVQTTPPAQEQTASTANSFVEKAKTAIAGLGEPTTEKDLSSDIAKLANKDSVASGTRIKFTAGEGSVHVVMLALKDSSKFEDVKKEVKAQYDVLSQISATSRVVWLNGDSSTIALVYYKTSEETLANKVVAVLEGKATTTVPPATLPSSEVSKITGTFAVGETVLADWNGGAMWWEAKVTKVEGNKISVKYTSDNTTGTLDIKAVAHKPTGTAKVSVGDKVVAKWNGGSFYGATVKSITGNTAAVDWDDKTTGTTPLSDIGFPGM